MGSIDFINTNPVTGSIQGHYHVIGSNGFYHTNPVTG